MMEKSSHHDKITGTFGEVLVLYAFSVLPRPACAS